MPDSPSSLGQTIRERRVALGLTQEQLAELISDDDEYVRQSEISRIEAGRVLLPRRIRLERIASVLGLSLVDLLMSSAWADEQTPESQPTESVEVVEQIVVADGPALIQPEDGIWTEELQRRRSSIEPDAIPAALEELTAQYENNLRRYESNKQRFEESMERFRARVEKASEPGSQLDCESEPA